jgi:catechol 2,3-dioxygenase-like lactoylglutathione lyase family enzyme
MRLRHLNLQVSDVDAAREFFETYFGLKCTYQRQKQIAFFTDETGFEFAVSNLFDSPPPKYPADFHVGFILEHTTQVRDLYDLLRKAGIPMRLELGVQGPNLVFQCTGPDSIPVEVRAANDS